MDANEMKVTRLKNAEAAGTSDITSSALDMRGFENATFLVPFGTIDSSAVTSVKVQQSSDDGSTDAYSDLAGTSVTVADDDDNRIAVVSIVKPAKRYLKCIVDRGTANAVVDGIIAIQTGAYTLPVTQPTSVVGSAAEIHVSPAEGTA